MAVKSSGALSFTTDIVGEFGGTTPHSLSEYIRGGSLVPDGPADNADIPTTTADINFSDFYDSVSTVLVTYEMIGGGGGGGAGEIGNDTPTGSAPDGGTGGTTSFSGTGFTTVSATGGAGGQGNSGAPYPTGGPAGQASFYGAGGAGGINSDTSGRPTDGSSPAATSYGAGGGGGGTSFETNSSATQAQAAVRKTGTIYIAPGTNVSITIGAGGAGTSSNSLWKAGAAGAGGYLKLTVTGHAAVEFTTPGSHSYTIPS